MALRYQYRDTCAAVRRNWNPTVAVRVCLQQSSLFHFSRSLLAFKCVNTRWHACGLGFLAVNKEAGGSRDNIKIYGKSVYCQTRMIVEPA